MRSRNLISWMRKTLIEPVYGKTRAYTVSGKSCMASDWDHLQSQLQMLAQQCHRAQRRVPSGSAGAPVGALSNVIRITCAKVKTQLLATNAAGKTAVSADCITRSHKMANEKDPKNLTPFLSWAMFQHYCRDLKISQSEWDAACDILNENGSYPLDEMINNVKSCVVDIREVKASRKAERDAKKAAKVE